MDEGEMRRVTGLVAGLPGCSVVNFAEKTQVLLAALASLSLLLRLDFLQISGIVTGFAPLRR
jgi:hypothetical protein